VKLLILPDRIPLGRVQPDWVPHFSRSSRESLPGERSKGGPPPRPADRLLSQPSLHPIPYSMSSWTEQSRRRKTDPCSPKMRSRFFQSACYRWLHEVVHQQQLPVVRPGSLHDRYPLHFLPMRFETHLDAKRNHTRAENSPGSRQEDRLIVPISRPVLGPRELTPGIQNRLQRRKIRNIAGHQRQAMGFCCG
jgi:hypothetical protein